MNRNYSLLKMSPFNFYNILIHITYNPPLFMQCIQSILAQTYKNYKIYACYEDDRCVEFLKLYPQINSIKIHRENNESPNKCYNHLLNRVTDGWILFLNNNMMFAVSQTLYYINKYTISDQDILFWKVKLGSDELVPNIHDVKMGEIHSTGYCFHSKFKNKSNWNNGDYISGLLKDKFLIRRFIPGILVQSILKELPPINILIRNTYRPSTFSKCIVSILTQTYTNYKIIMCYDDDRCLEYLTPYMTHSKIEIFKVNRESEERYFYNLYCNYLLDKVNTGWIIFLDDDKKFTRADTLDIIYQNIKTEEDIILWKVKLGQYIIFPNIHDIKFGEIDSTSFCFHSKFKNKSRWIAKHGSDFHYITNILNNTSLKRQFIPMILAQSVLENSFGQKGIKEEYKFKEFIDQFNIKQIYISNSLIHLKTRLLQRYKLQNYHNTREPSIFFGIYTNDDLNSIKHHNHSAYLMPGGSEVSNSQYFKEYQFLAISKDIKTRLIQFNIFPTIIQLNLVDRSLFKPVHNLGTKIFIYDGIRKKSDNAYIYGKPFYDKVIEKLPQYKYIFSSDLNIPYEKMPEIYAQCFIGLRLTPHDGNANMVQEMEVMNIPVVHNHSEYGLKWRNVEDIVGHINREDTKKPNYFTINNFNSINIENIKSYTDLINNSNGDNINETNFIKNIQNQNKTLYYNNHFISGNNNLKSEITISRNKNYNQIIHKKNVFLSSIPYKKECDGLYCITKSMIDAIKDQNSMLYPYVYDHSLFNEINKKPILLQEQKVHKHWYNWASDKEIKQLKLNYFPEDAFVICICGRIAINSYPKSLLEAIKILRSQDHNIHLLVLSKLEVNPHRLTQKLYDEITSYDWIKSFVVDKKDVLNYFRMCDVLASTYRDYCNHVGGSNKIKEYLLCDKPIICSRGKERERELGKDYFGLYDCETCNTVPPLCWTQEFLKNPNSYNKQYDKYFKTVDEDISLINNEIKKLYNLLKYYNKTITKINIIYNSNTFHINTVFDFDKSFIRYSKNNIKYYDYNKNLIDILNIKNGIILLAYSVIHYMLTHRDRYIKLIEFIIKSKLKKIFIIQDEYYHCDLINKFIKDSKVDLVYTCLNEIDVEKIYGENILNTKFKRILTGYIEKKNINIKKIKDRNIDIFYRGRKLHYFYGELGYLKYKIGNEMKKYANKYNLRYDIEMLNDKRIYGNDWSNILLNSKVMLGSLSGSNVINRTNDLHNKINNHYKIKYLHALGDDINYSYPDTFKKFNIKEELNVGQISPKMFEAIQHGTVLVLFEGNYSNILIPDVHYISLKEDFSNIEDVINKIKDDKFLQNMADRAYKDIVETNKYSYKNFIKNIDSEINTMLDKNKTIHIFFMKEHLSVSCIYEYFLSFRYYSSYNVKYYDINDEEIYNIDKGVILIMYDIATYLAINTNNKYNKQINFIKNYKHKKAIFKQDEYDYTEPFNDLLNIIDVDIIFTCINKLKDIPKIYYKIPNEKIKFVNVLTGYISESLINKKTKKIKYRNLHIGYRGRELNYRYGILGQDKLNIGIDIKEYSKKYSKKYGLNTDIEVKDEKRIYGENWYNFIMNTKTMLASESGCNIIDYNNELIVKVNKLLHNSNLYSAFIPDNPKFTFKECVKKLKLEETLQINQISPKMFEAIALRTVLIMYEGEYSGILKENKHYISVKKDYSNIDEVINKIKDDKFLQNMADTTYRDIVESNKYNYKSFVKKVEKELFN